MLPEVPPPTPPEPQKKSSVEVWLTRVVITLASVFLLLIFVQIAVDLKWPQRYLGVGGGEEISRQFLPQDDTNNPNPQEGEREVEEEPPVDTGPGIYACDPLGACNHYADSAEANCPKTFADRNCLNACGDEANRCTK